MMIFLTVTNTVRIGSFTHNFPVRTGTCFAVMAVIETTA